jgi:hypothetical protein
MISSICKLSLTAALAIPIGLFAQNVAPANPGGTPAGAQGTNIYVLGNGLYGNGIFVTPSAGFASPPPTTGISLAGRAGISLGEAIPVGVQSTLQPTPLTYYNGSPITYSYGTAPEYAGEATSAESGPLIRDLLPSYSSEGGGTQAPSLSVAEVAAQYKANRPQMARTFSNADAQRLANNVTIAGTSVSGGITPAPAPITPAAAPTAKPEPPAPPTETTAGNLTPPITTEQPSQLAAPSHAPTRLPATSTLLPLLGLAGLLSGGLGFWLRRRFSR